MATLMLKQQLLVKNQIKTIECYEPIHKHNSYSKLMGHGALSHQQGHHPALEWEKIAFMGSKKY